MKKLIFTLFGLSLFFTSLKADCTLIPQYPGSGPAPSAYCWDIAYIHSQDRIDNDLPWEYTANSSSTTINHNGTIYAAIEVFGYGGSNSTTINNQDMTLIMTENIFNVYNILIGKRYYYMENGTTYSSGTVKTYNYSSFKDQLYVR